MIQEKSPPNPLLWTLVPVVVFSALAFGFFTSLKSSDPAIIPSALEGSRVPEFVLEPLAGLSREGAQVPGLVSADLSGSGVTVVNIWASWCGPCRQEHPLLMQMRAAGLRIVGINYKDEPENGRRFLGSLGNPYQAVGVDEKGRAAIDWGVYGVPETFVVDNEGIIQKKHVGPLSPLFIEENILPVIRGRREQ
jgi:cytochrome c biogenesis protein CcmG/thiol:disulfide interchange protein DsbE